ncbi:cupin domain-containing protein [bacterium]|nr:cupin domain-containing protein [bacterium]MBU1984737.1 cupin domain-containing protein [bacterium]
MTELNSLQPFVFTPPENPPHYVRILAADQTVAMKSGMVTLSPGQSVGEHSTERHEEQLVILEGSGVVVADGMGEQEVSAGQFVYIPPETRHNVIAASDSLLRYVFIVCRVPTGSAP